MNSSLMTIVERDEPVKGRLFKHSMLYLCDLKVSYSGNYTCSVSNGTFTLDAQVELIVDHTINGKHNTSRLIHVSH